MIDFHRRNKISEVKKRTAVRNNKTKSEQHTSAANTILMSASETSNLPAPVTVTQTEYSTQYVHNDDFYDAPSNMCQQPPVQQNENANYDTSQLSAYALIEREDLTNIIKEIVSSTVTEIMNRHMAAQQVKLDNITNKIDKISDSLQKLWETQIPTLPAIRTNIVGEFEFPLQNACDVFKLDAALSDTADEKQLIPSLVKCLLS